MFSIIFSIGVYACTNVVQIQSIRPQLWIFRTFILHFICISQKVERKSANKRINRYTLAHMYVCMYAAVLLSDREAFIFGWFACKHDRSQCHLENLYSNGILKYTKKKKYYRVFYWGHHFVIACQNMWKDSKCADQVY